MEAHRLRLILILLKSYICPLAGTMRTKRFSYRKPPCGEKTFWVRDVGTGLWARRLYARDPPCLGSSVISLQFTPLFPPCSDDLKLPIPSSRYPVPVVVGTGMYPERFLCRV